MCLIGRRRCSSRKRLCEWIICATTAALGFLQCAKLCKFDATVSHAWWCRKMTRSFKFRVCSDYKFKCHTCVCFAIGVYRTVFSSVWKYRQLVSFSAQWRITNKSNIEPICIQCLWHSVHVYARTLKSCLTDCGCLPNHSLQHRLHSAAAVYGRCWFLGGFFFVSWKL